MKQIPKNMYLIFVTYSVIFLTISTFLCGKFLVEALPQTSRESFFHFPDVKDSKVKKDGNLQNIHRIIFEEDNNNRFSSFSNENRDK